MSHGCERPPINRFHLVRWQHNPSFYLSMKTLLFSYCFYFIFWFSPDKQNELELPCPVPKSRDRKRRQGQQQQHCGMMTQISGVRKVSHTPSISGSSGNRFGVKTDQEELLSKVCHGQNKKINKTKLFVLLRHLQPLCLPSNRIWRTSANGA